MANFWFAKEAGKLPTSVSTIGRTMRQSNVGTAQFNTLYTGRVNNSTLPVTTVVGYTPVNFGSNSNLGLGSWLFTKPGQTFTSPDDVNILRFPTGAVMIQARAEPIEPLVWSVTPAPGAVTLNYGSLPTQNEALLLAPIEDINQGVVVSGADDSVRLGTAGTRGILDGDKSFCQVLLFAPLNAGSLKVTLTYVTLPRAPSLTADAEAKMAAAAEEAAEGEEAAALV